MQKLMQKVNKSYYINHKNHLKFHKFSMENGFRGNYYLTIWKIRLLLKNIKKRLQKFKSKKNYKINKNNNNNYKFNNNNHNQKMIKI